MTDEAKEVEAALVKLDEKIGEALKKYDGQLAESGSVAKELRDEVKSLSETHKLTSEKQEALLNRIDDMEKKMADGLTPDAPEYKSMGQLVTGSEQFKAFAEGNVGRLRIEMKNTILGTEGSPPENSATLTQADRLSGIIPGAFRNLRITDVLPMGSTGSNNVEYTRELTFSNGAAEVNEGDTKPETDLTFELANAPVRTIAHWIRTSVQVLDDAPALQTYINRRMQYGVNLRAETQIINGDGNAPNLSGILDSGNFTAFTPITGENGFESINRAKYSVIGADYMANLVMLNPADWGVMERVKTSGGGDGHFVGAIASTYIQGGLVPLLWGLPVVASNTIPEGTFVAMDTNAVQIFNRMGTVVELFREDSDNVTRNLVTIRAEVRLAFAVFRPAAIVSGLLVAT